MKHHTIVFVALAENNSARQHKYFNNLSSENIDICTLGTRSSYTANINGRQVLYSSVHTLNIIDICNNFQIIKQFLENQFNGFMDGSCKMLV